MKKLRIAGVILVIIITSFFLVLSISPTIRSQVSSISGLAVAQSPLQWNNLKDAAAGDALTNGVGCFNPYLYNGTSFDRVRGDTTYGMWVNIKAIPSVGVYTTTSSTIATNQVTVDTTAGGIVIKASNASRKSIIIRNQGLVDMYIGPTGVTSSNGLLIKAGESITLDRNTAAIYGITAATSTTAGYLEE